MREIFATLVTPEGVIVLGTMLVIAAVIVAITLLVLSISRIFKYRNSKKRKKGGVDPFAGKPRPYHRKRGTLRRFFRGRKAVNNH